MRVGAGAGDDACGTRHRVRHRVPTARRCDVDRPRGTDGTTEFGGHTAGVGCIRTRHADRASADRGTHGSGLHRCAVVGAHCDGARSHGPGQAGVDRSVIDGDADGGAQAHKRAAAACEADHVVGFVARQPAVFVVRDRLHGDAAATLGDRGAADMRVNRRAVRGDGNRRPRTRTEITAGNATSHIDGVDMLGGTDGQPGRGDTAARDGGGGGVCGAGIDFGLCLVTGCCIRAGRVATAHRAIGVPRTVGRGDTVDVAHAAAGVAIGLTVGCLTQGDHAHRSTHGIHRTGTGGHGVEL